MQYPGEIGQVSWLRDKWERWTYWRTGRWPDSKVRRRLAYTYKRPALHLDVVDRYER